LQRGLVHPWCSGLFHLPLNQVGNTRVGGVRAAKRCSIQAGITDSLAARNDAAASEQRRNWP
jgi:hypothetical protein